MKPPQYIIKQFGGVCAAARAIGRSPSAVSRWKKKGEIPGDAIRPVVKALQRKGQIVDVHFLVYGR